MTDGSSDHPNTDTQDSDHQFGELAFTALAIVVAVVSLVVIKVEVFEGLLVYIPQAILTLAVAWLIGVGADWLVDSSCRIAELLGISHLVIGLTVVAFGTSAPEMAASLEAGFQGNGDITVANVVGSNIFNICFILGGVALLVKGGLKADRELVFRDGPILLLGTILLFLFVGGIPGSTAAPKGDTGQTFWPVLLNLKLERVEGIILGLSLFAYLYTLYLMNRRSSAARKEQEQDDQPKINSWIPEDKISFGEPSWRDIPLFIGGLLLVLLGCHVLVGKVEVSEGAIKGFGALWFAQMWGVPDYIVGVTIVAAGTSAPEFIVSLVAAMRGAYGLSAGNLVGSDIFNMFGVVGLAGVVLQKPIAEPISLTPSVIPSLMALCALIVVTIIFMRTGWKVSKWEGVLLVLIGMARWAMDFTFLGRI